MICNINAASPTLRVIGPAWDTELLFGTGA